MNDAQAHIWGAAGSPMVHHVSSVVDANATGESGGFVWGGENCCFQALPLKYNKNYAQTIMRTRHDGLTEPPGE